MTHIGIIGCGAWATTVAKLCADNGQEVSLLCHRDAYVDAINNNHENTFKLPGVTLPNSIQASVDPQCLSQCELLIIACPSSHISWIETIFPHCSEAVPLLSIVKGVSDRVLESSSLNSLVQNPRSLLLSSYIASVFPNSSLAVLSGPNLAGEISQELPATSVVASLDHDLATKIQDRLSSPQFRVYRSDDVVGVELGGLLKNIIAIAAGVLDELKLGHNAKASLITRGLQEMIRFGAACSAQKETFFGLSGMGDLIATCSSPSSRNYRLGVGLAQGLSLTELLEKQGIMAEGVRTTKLIWSLAQKLGIDMPITEQIYAVLFENKTCKDALHELMTRRLTSEL